MTVDELVEEVEELAKEFDGEDDVVLDLAMSVTSGQSQKVRREVLARLGF